MATTESKLMTTEEFLNLPEKEGVTQELIDGQLRERTVTTRNAKHSMTLIRIGHLLVSWIEENPKIDGVVAGGEARCRLSTNPDNIVGIDVGYFADPEAIARAEEEGFFDGAPVLAVEVLSPSDTHEDIRNKIRRYLDAGTKQVWVADPDFRSVTVYRPGAEPVLFNAQQELDGKPDLPGFHVGVAELFSGK